MIGILLGLALAGASCQATSSLQNTNMPSTNASTLRGVSLSPQKYSGSQLSDFFDQAVKAGQVISWAGRANDLSTSTGGAHLVLTQATKKHLTPVIITSPTKEDITSSGGWATWHDRVVSFAASTQPPYLGLGNEINKAYDAKTLSLFSQKFSSLVTDIKKVSPETKVFPIFQLEWMRGLHGGLFGGKNNAADTQWDDIALFPEADMIGITSYPGLIYGTPGDVPDTYFQDIAAHTDKPIAITETAWFRTGPAGWESSAQEQADYVRRLFTLTRSLDPAMIIWPFLYDQSVTTPFSSMGLLTGDQQTSPAWEAWQQGT